ncbi:MAG: nitroreductase, partial [Chitinophagaceae bacterium]
MMMEISRLIRQRRTTKPSKMKPGGRVPDTVIMDALENATWAPNHGKTEPWFFVVFTGEGLANFCHAQSELYKKESGDNFNPAKFKNLREWSNTVSHLIAICHRRSILTKIPELEEIEAIACGVQNLGLTIEAHGFA